MAALRATSPDGAGEVRAAAAAVVKIGRRPLDGRAMARIQDIAIERTLDEVGQLTLRLVATDDETRQLGYVDDGRFDPGAEVEVELGYAGQPVSLFQGEIVSLDLEVSAEAPPILTVTAYDFLHRLGRGKRSFPYRRKTYAEIVRDIARSRYNLAVDAETDAARDPQRPIVQQENESDLSFVLGLAHQIGYELFADGARIVFRRSRLGTPPVLTLDLASDLLRFSARLAAASQLGGVDVISLQTDSKEHLRASASNAGAADGRFRAPATREVIIDDSLTTQAEAQALAQAELTRIRGSYLDATATALGRPDLTAGMAIRIDNLGARFSGPYYITSITHSLSPMSGLRSSLSLKGPPR
jgi:phage protein D